jgi:hypothetical protein
MAQTAAEKQKAYRDRQSNGNAPVTELVKTGSMGRTTDATNIKHYATRTNPDLLNYGTWMTSAELKQAGRIQGQPRPHSGDYDYAGVAV